MDQYRSTYNTVQCVKSRKVGFTVTVLRIPKRTRIDNSSVNARENYSFCP